MVRYFRNFELKNSNTFGIAATADEYFEFTELDDIGYYHATEIAGRQKEILVLGGGSNMLFTGNVKKTVIKPNVPGIAVIAEDRNYVWFEVGAGETWDDFVSHCTVLNLGGIENLSAIPGTTGAAPVQNIGAYGQEVAGVIERVNVFDLKEGKAITFLHNECEFEYRGSIFKNRFRNQYVIVSVVFRLEKFPEYRLDYGNLAQVVKQKGEINLSTIRQAVIEIRNAKLPDYRINGNAGSFFKNPEVDENSVQKIKSVFPEIPVFAAANGRLRVPAGWLIEKAGWKGFRSGDAGVHPQQALILVNYGNATGNEIVKLADKITKSVYEKFGILLEKEVNVVE